MEPPVRDLDLSLVAHDARIELHTAYRRLRAQLDAAEARLLDRSGGNPTAHQRFVDHDEVVTRLGSLPTSSDRGILMPTLRHG